MNKLKELLNALRCAQDDLDTMESALDDCENVVAKIDAYTELERICKLIVYQKFDNEDIDIIKKLLKVQLEEVK